MEAYGKDVVDWSCDFVSDAAFKKRPDWADPPCDTDGKLDPEFVAELEKRQTYEGPIIFDDNGRPLNPRGRTGLRGRGLLGRWGPNHAIDLLLTRDHPVTRGLQVVVIKRGDADQARKSVQRTQRRATPSVMKKFSSSLGLTAADTPTPDSPPSQPMASRASGADDEHCLPGLSIMPSNRALGTDALRAEASTARQRNIIVQGASEEDTWGFPGKLIDDFPDLKPRQAHRLTARGGMVLNEELKKKLFETFLKEAFAHKEKELEDSDKRRFKRIRDRISDLSSGSLLYAGYVDDPRNTDNAWIETAAVHMHCPFELGAELKLKAGEGERARLHSIPLIVRC